MTAKNMFRILRRILSKNAWRIIYYLPDTIVVKRLFKRFHGYNLNLDNPSTFCEKLQWLKLNNRQPEYTIMVDKYAAKNYVSSVIGESYIIPTLGVWNKPEDITWEKLPARFVLKTTHNSGGVKIINDNLNIADTLLFLDKELKYDVYKTLREWPYKHVPPRIIAEEYKEDALGGELNDYKFFCFNGKVKFFKVDYDRSSSHGATYFWPDATIAPFREVLLPSRPERVKLPPKTVLNEMISCAELLSANIPFVRIVFYYCKDHIFFGEITFFPGSGHRPFIPAEWEKHIGQWIKLPLT